MNLISFLGYSTSILSLFTSFAKTPKSSQKYEETEATNFSDQFNQFRARSYFYFKLIYHKMWQDVEQATVAMDALQGSSLPSSDRGGMKIEYSLFPT